MAIGGDVVAHVVAKVDADTSDMGPQIKRSMAKALQKGDAEKMGDDWAKSFYKGVHREIRSGSTKAGGEWSDGFFRNLRAQFKNQRMKVDVDVDFDTLGAKIHKFSALLPGMMGRSFGKGSRNDFLNVIGSMVQGVAEFAQGTVKAFGFVAKALGELPEVVGTLTKSFKGLFDQAEGGASFFTKLGGSVGEGLGTLTKMGGPITMVGAALATVVAVTGGAVFAFFALGEAVAVIASALSMLAAGAIAVGSAVGAGIIGVIGAAIPLMVGLAAAIGTVVIAFKNMSDAQKKTLEPIKKQMGKIGEEISKVFLKDLPIWLKTASDLLKDFGGPLLKGVATNVRDAVTGIAKDFQRPEIKKALSSWADALGPIAGDLTTALGKALTGMVSFFQPLMPLARELATAIKNIATQFSDWAASAAGQAGIKDFFDKAWESAKQLWEILKNVGTTIGEVFGAGQESVQGFLTWLCEVTRKLADFLKSPEGQQQLKQWFQDAKTFGEQLFTAIGKVVEAFQRLDTAGNREFATQIIAGIGGIMDVVGKLGPAFEATGRALGAMATIAAKGFAFLLETISVVTGVMSGFFAVLGKVPGFGWAKEIATDLGAVSASTDAASESLRKLPDEINMMFKADDTDLQDAQMALQELTSVQQPDVMTKFVGDTKPLDTAAGAALATVHGIPPEVLTSFDGDMGPLTAVADAAVGAVNSVPDENTTSFAGEDSPLFGTVTQVNHAIDGVPDANTTTFEGLNSQLVGTATSATGAINAVPDDNTTAFRGTDSGLGGAAKTAQGAVNSVPDENTTYFKGDVSAITAAIQRAKAQIAGLMASVGPGAMGNEDLGQRAAGGIVGMAAGSVLRGPQVLLAGEDGPEAIVPLRRSLGRVDPSVRGLSAFAQGLVPQGKSINIQPGAIQVTVPNTDPQLAAAALLDRFAILVN